MIDLGPSTNKGVALLKILHQRETSPIVEDHYSRWFFSEAQLAQIQELPVMAADPPLDPDDHFVWSAYWYTILRERFVDDALSDALTSGCLQVLNLGAGFDTRFFRLIEPQAAPIHAFEVDLPDTIDEKRRCIESHLGHMPDHLHLVPLNLVEDSLGTLARHGFDPQVPTAVVLQGVSYYLPKQSALALLRFLATDTAPGSQLIYDSCYPTMIYENDLVPGIRAQIQKLNEIGEPYLFGETPAEAADRLSNWGCTDVQTFSVQEIESRYRGRTTLPNEMWFIVRATKP